MNCQLEFDFPAVENWNEVFASHLSQVSLNLLGGPGRSTAADGGSTSVADGSPTSAQKESALEKNMVKKDQGLLN